MAAAVAAVMELLYLLPSWFAFLPSFILTLAQTIFIYFRLVRLPPSPLHSSYVTPKLNLLSAVHKVRFKEFLYLCVPSLHNGRTLETLSSFRSSCCHTDVVKESEHSPCSNVATRLRLADPSGPSYNPKRFFLLVVGLNVEEPTGLVPQPVEEPTQFTFHVNWVVFFALKEEQKMKRKMLFLLESRLEIWSLVKHHVHSFTAGFNSWVWRDFLRVLLMPVWVSSGWVNIQSWPSTKCSAEDLDLVWSGLCFSDEDG